VRVTSPPFRYFHRYFHRPEVCICISFRTCIAKIFKGLVSNVCTHVGYLLRWLVGNNGSHCYGTRVSTLCFRGIPHVVFRKLAVLVTENPQQQRYTLFSTFFSRQSRKIYSKTNVDPQHTSQSQESMLSPPETIQIDCNLTYKFELQIIRSEVSELRRLRTTIGNATRFETRRAYTLQLGVDLDRENTAN
jgi:hypothetical protein